MTGIDVKIRLYMLWYQSSYLRPPPRKAPALLTAAPLLRPFLRLMGWRDVLVVLNPDV